MVSEPISTLNKTLALIATRAAVNVQAGMEPHEAIILAVVVECGENNDLAYAITAVFDAVAEDLKAVEDGTAVRNFGPGVGTVQ